MLKHKKFVVIICVPLLFLSGCASFALKLMDGGKTVRVPQIVAHLEPVLKDNKIILLGNIVIENPSESDLALEKINLSIKDENNNVIEKSILKWSKTSVETHTVLESPVKIDLDLATLNKKLISVNLRTAFTYKRFGIRIPIESQIAVLHLDFLKESIVRPLDITIHTKLRAITFSASIDYALDIANPVGIDLLLENGQIVIYDENKELAKSTLTDTLFKAGQSSRIQGSLHIKNFFKKILTYEFIKKHPLRFKMTGDLRVPETDISMPFKVESIQEVDFSLFGRSE